MREKNKLITQQLKERYESIVSGFNQLAQLDKIALSIPQVSAAYQFHFNDLLKEYHLAQDVQDEYFHDAMFNAKTGRGKLAVANFGASELKKMIESDEKFREHTRKLNEIQEEMKLVEEMLTTIKNFGFNISSVIKFRELVGGA